MVVIFQLANVLDRKPVYVFYFDLLDDKSFSPVDFSTSALDVTKDSYARKKTQLQDQINRWLVRELNVKQDTKADELFAKHYTVPSLQQKDRHSCGLFILEHFHRVNSRVMTEIFQSLLDQRLFDKTVWGDANLFKCREQWTLLWRRRWIVPGWDNKIRGAGK